MHEYLANNTIYILVCKFLVNAAVGSLQISHVHVQHGKWNGTEQSCNYSKT
jgi:hypothetical protein